MQTLRLQKMATKITKVTLEVKKTRAEKWLDLRRIRLDTVPILNTTTEDAPVQNVSEVIAPLDTTVPALPPFIPTTWICCK